MADNITSTYDLDITSLLNKLQTVENKFVEVGGALKKSVNDDPFREAAQGANGLEKELSANTKKVAELEAITSTYAEEVKRLNAELSTQQKRLKDVSNATKYKQQQAEIKAVKEEVKKLNTELSNTSKKGKEAASIMSRIKGGFLGAFTGLATGGGAGVQGAAAALGAINPVLGVATGLLGSFASKAFQATAQWQGYEVALKNSLGSQELANQNLSVLEQLAVKLPVGLNEVTESFNQLVNRGFKPTKDELANLSGFAAAQNKTFDQLIQAILDAEQGELERLKEFGIKASNEGDKVKVTFRGITQEFTKGAGQSASAFAELARQLGSDALNADKMQTLAGRMSNLGDQSDRLARKFGEILLPAFEKMLDISSKLLDVVNDSIVGYTNFDISLRKAGKAAEYSNPLLEKLFNIIAKPFEGKTVEDFFFALSAGFEKLGEFLKYNVAQLNPLKSYQESAKNYKAYTDNIQRINDAIDKRMRDKSLAARRERRNGLAGEADFVYNNTDTAGGSKIPTEAELKLAEKRLRDLAELERKLQEELLKIENEYGKEKLESLKDNELKYLEEKRKYDLLKIDQEEKALLRLKQIVSGARKGQYDRNGKVIADTSAMLTATERAPFDFRRDLVNSEAYKAQAEFISKAEREITSILSNEYQQQLQDVEYKYAELFKLAQKSGIDITKLEKQKQKEIEKIILDKNLADIEKRALVEQGDAELNIIQAQIDGRVDKELEGRKGLLEIEKKFLLQKIAAIEASGGEEADAIIRGLKKLVAEVDKGIKDIEDKEKERSGLSKYLSESLGLSDKEIQETYDAARAFASSMESIMSDLYSTLNRLSDQRIQRIDDEIKKKEEQVDREQELDEQGLANNLTLRQKELEDLKAARERALDDQKRLQRQQLIVDTASQASSMITAASKVFSGFSAIPVVGVGLGIAAVALMLGAFAAAKIKAFQLVNQQAPQFEKGGRHKGRRHSEGGEIVEVEDGEWTINRNSSAEYDELLAAINQNNKGAIMDYLLSELLDGTGVSMSDAERRRQKMFMSSYERSKEYTDNAMVTELREMKQKLADIESHVSYTPKHTETSLGNGKVLKTHIKTGSKETFDYSEMIKEK